MMSMGSTSIPVYSLTSRITVWPMVLPTSFLCSAGDGVEVVVGASDHQKPAVLVLRERAHRHDDVGRLRGVGVVVVVGAGHGAAPKNVARWAEAQTVSRLSE